VTKVNLQFELKFWDGVYCRFEINCALDSEVMDRGDRLSRAKLQTVTRAPVSFSSHRARRLHAARVLDSAVGRSSSHPILWVITSTRGAQGSGPGASRLPLLAMTAVSSFLVSSFFLIFVSPYVVDSRLTPNSQSLRINYRKEHITLILRKRIPTVACMP